MQTHPKGEIICTKCITHSSHTKVNLTCRFCTHDHINVKGRYRHIVHGI